MNSLAQNILNPVASVAHTLPTPPTDERRPSPATAHSYPSMSTSAHLDQPRRQHPELPPFSLPQTTRSYSPSANLGSLPTPPPGESYTTQGSGNSYPGYAPYGSQSGWPTSSPQHSQNYSISMTDANPSTNSPGGSYRGMSPSAGGAYPIQPVGSFNYGASPHSPPSRESRNNSPYQGEYLPGPSSGMYNQGPPQHQNPESGHYQSYPPANLPPLQHNPMLSQHGSSYQGNPPNGSQSYNYFQYGQAPTSGSMPENSSTLPPPMNRPPLPQHLSQHHYQQYPPPSSYPSSQPYMSGPGAPGFRYGSPPMDPSLRSNPYSRPPSMMRPGSGGLVVNNQERPFKCDQCPQSFNRNHDLKRHKRIHLAVKPFPCPSCDKSFSRKDALKRHILVKGCGNRQPNETAQQTNPTPQE